MLESGYTFYEQEGFTVGTNGSLLIYLDELSEMTLNEARARLEELDAYFLLPLAKQYYETINLPTIETIKLVEGITNTFELVTNLDTTMDLTYNYVTPAPSINRESEVQYLNGNVDILVQNKNLAKLDQSYNTNYKEFTYVKETPENITAKITQKGGRFYATFIANIKQGKIYTIKGKVNDIPNNVQRVYTYKDKTWGTGVFNLGADKLYDGYNFTATYTGLLVIAIYIDKQTEDEITLTCENLQLEKNNISTDYTPHQEQLYPVDLTEYPLYGENDKIVYITKERALELGLTDGEGWYVYNEFDRYDFKNILVEDINHVSGWKNPNAFYVINKVNHGIDGYNTLANVYCNTMKAETPSRVADKNIYNVIGLGGNSTIYFSLKEFTTAQQYADYFNNNDVYMIYPLATPIYTKITNEVLINQLENFTKNAYTYDEQTNIEVIGKNGQVEGIYFKDLENEINNLKALILEQKG